jgi:hypothetical protein
MTLKLVKFVNNSKKFITNVDKATDNALSAMSVDIIRLSKLQVPVDKGPLKSSGIVKKIADKRYQIQYNKEYALYQHEGKRADGSHVIRRHSTPGTKTKYLVDPGEQITKNWKNYVIRSLSTIKI